MDSGLEQAIDQANQTNNAIAWVIILVPLLLLVSTVIAVILIQRARKCPKCGNWRKGNHPAVQTTKSDNKSTTKGIWVCGRCGHEYTV